MVHLNCFVPADHPLREVRGLLNKALGRLDGLSNLAYAPYGKESIAPEKLLRALMEQVQYKVGLARERGLLSDERFGVDGALIQDWTSQKSFRPRADKDGGPKGGGATRSTIFMRKKRSNETHAYTTGAEARHCRKSASVGARLAYLGHTLMESRNGLPLDGEVSQTDGHGERESARKMLSRRPGRRRKTVDAGKGCDTRDVFGACRAVNVTPHTSRATLPPGGSASNARTTHHKGCEASLRARKRIEEHFGWDLIRVRNVEEICA